MEVAKNQPPIINAVIRGGLNLLTSERPIGLRNSSPMVITAYDEINHQELALIVPLSLYSTAQTITRQDKAEISKPIAILAGVDGSFPFLRRKAKNANIKGVRAITQNGFTD